MAKGTGAVSYTHLDVYKRQALRFHLHPNVRASLVRNGTGALLALASGEVWSFEAGGLTIAIEESIFLASSDGRRRTEQLVIAFDAVTTPRVTWRLSRISAANPRAGKTVAAAIAEREAREPAPDA